MALTKNRIGSDPGLYNFENKKHRWTVFGAGAFASATMTLTMLLAQIAGLVPRSLANILSDKLATLFPAQIQEFFIQSIGPMGKTLLFYGVLLGQIVAGGLLALFLIWFVPRIENSQMLWRNSFILSVSIWVVTVLIGLPLMGAGFVGADLGQDQVIILLSSFLLFQLYGLALGYFFLKLMPESSEDVSVRRAEDESDEEIGNVPGRRRFILGLTAFFVVALAAGIGVGAFKVKNPGYWVNLGAGYEGDKLKGEITPVDTFYGVSKNVIDPNVNATDWKLEINGMVDKPIAFDYASISKLPAVTRTHTLTCISNPVGGQLIGNGEWKGTPLKDILAQVGVKSGAKKLVFTCADGYTDSITLDKAQDPNTLLVWEMDGVPLPQAHGFPVRALIPDIYGMKNAKWIRSITLINTEYEGYWQQEGWDNLAIIKTESTITSLQADEDLRSGEPVTVHGFAFAGARGIKKVEVSSDGGKTWQEARIKEAINQNSWQLWQFDWTPVGAGKTVTLTVRATDGTGAPQLKDNAAPFPSGSSGYHSVNVHII
ncbi:MAG: molybdopterin-dependent oxidoreductase [Chloroflexi bacterium]|uniref:Molybdopterin-dependent oxidoreductase n=1 Tax=Candidatus Chlorohelix allophototropha TaxID=3003348 RepID=A0A8T7LYR8_9CHLR|nr:molybdopterin-dependent oxidoreductase [Chloroflexota bacterium]WJW66508.1 molybdopterin-dependent oxidoreductase [Chloroflexota bacterium L227-S17]